MSLKNLMEYKQLNLDQPLLSVRRNPSIVASGKDDTRKISNSLLNVPQPPRYKSELKSGPVSNPGVVPFFWEQIPGKPKDEIKPQADTSERPVPKLPPGRTSVANQWNSDNGPGSVQHSVEIIKKYESFNSSKAIMEDDENYESADEGEMFLDALDTLSRTESVFLNCSVSGLSGLDEPDGKPSGTSSTDPQSREFMISRFLPAAKAMASEMFSEIPQYVPRKQAEVREQPRQLKKTVKPDRQPHTFARHYYHPRDYEEGTDDDNCNHENIPAKACGLLPRFCFRNSFCLLNPLPGMSVRTRVPKPSRSRMQTRSSYTGLCSGVENERPMSDASEGKPMVGLLTTEHCENKNRESEKDLMFRSNNQRPEGSSLYKQLLSSDVSANHNKPSQPNLNKVLLPTHGKANNASFDALGSPIKVCRSFRELLAAEDSSVQEDSGYHVAEKTLYVDTVHRLESLIPKSSSPEIEETSHLSEVDNEILLTKIEEKQFVGYFQDAGKLNSVDKEAKIMPIVQETSNLDSLPTTDKLNYEAVRKPGNTYGQARHYYEETITSVKADNECVRGSLKQDRTVKSKNPHAELIEFPVPPPLPKSPSDSWLCRTLPSLSTKKSALHPNLGTGNPINQAPKWETIVKTTKWQDQHLRYSEELVAFRPIPEAL